MSNDLRTKMGPLWTEAIQGGGVFTVRLIAGAFTFRKAELTHGPWIHLHDASDGRDDVNVPPGGVTINTDHVVSIQRDGATPSVGFSAAT